MIRLSMLIACALTLSACAASHNHETLNNYLAKRGISAPSANEFQSCRAYGCQKIDKPTLSKKDWKKIDKAFRRKAKSAEAERKKIAKAIAAFEAIVGEQTGTSEDIFGTFEKTGAYQQDCVDESINTSIYLRVLEERGHLKFHRAYTPQSRVSMWRWPHQTAVIQELETSERYAVDSWFHDNGAPPEILPLKTWKKHWRPDNEQQ